MNPTPQDPLVQPAGQPQPLVGPRPQIAGQPQHPALTPELEAKHKASKQRYPQLSLSAGEYVIEEVRRHPIGLVSIWLLTIFLILVILISLPLYGINHDLIAKTFLISPQLLPSAAILSIPALILVIFFGLGGVAATVVYEGNKFYITSESIIQFIQTGLFSTKQQTVNLINVEDVSSEQSGVLPQMLNYGTLKLSTQGEETTYHFQLVANPKRIVNLITDATERAVKLLQGYPVNEL